MCPACPLQHVGRWLDAVHAAAGARRVEQQVETEPTAEADVRDLLRPGQVEGADGGSDGGPVSPIEHPRNQRAERTGRPAELAAERPEQNIRDRDPRHAPNYGRKTAAGSSNAGGTVLGDQRRSYRQLPTGLASTNCSIESTLIRSVLRPSRTVSSWPSTM